MAEEALKDIVKKIIGKIEIKKGKGGADDVVAAWKKSVKKGIHNHTRPVSLRGGRLVVNVSDSSRLYELTLNKKEIIEALNKRLKRKKVREIRFRIGET